MQEIKIILLPPANAQRVKINHRPSSFFPLAQLRNKCSSEHPPSPCLRQELLRSDHTFAPPSHHPEPALERDREHLLQPPALRSHGSVPLLPPHLCRALRGAAASKLMCDYWEIQPSFRQWQREGEGRGFGGRWQRLSWRGHRPCSVLSVWGCVCYLVQMNKITHWCFKPITSLPLLKAGNLALH